MFPLSTVLFPEATLPLHVFEERYRSLMADCLGPEGEGEFGVVLITRGSEVGGGDQRVDVGTVARIAQVAELDDGRMLVVAHGERRVRVDRWLAEDPYPRARVEDLPADEGDGEAVVVAQAETAVRRLPRLALRAGRCPRPPPRPRGVRPPWGDRLAAVCVGPAQSDRPAATAGLRRPADADGAPGRAVHGHGR